MHANVSSFLENIFKDTFSRLKWCGHIWRLSSRFINNFITQIVYRQQSEAAVVQAKKA